MKHITFTFLFIALFFNNIFAQTLIVEYDFLKDDFTYFKLKKEGERIRVYQPEVKRNHQVKFEIKNFNPYLYTAKVNFTSTSEDNEVNLGFLNLISPLGLSGMGTSLLTELTASESSRGGLMSDRRASASYSDLQNSYNALAQSENSINSVKYVTERLYNLRLNPYLPTDSIKIFSQRIVEGLLNKNNVQTQDFIALGMQLNGIIENNYNQVYASTQKFSNAYDNYSSTRGKDRDFDGKNMNVQVDDIYSTAKQFHSAYSYTELVEYLDILELTYQSIMNTSFSFNTSEMAHGDNLEMDITVYQQPTADGAAVEPKEIKKRKMAVIVKGDIKISSSVGLSFPYYANNVGYINKDSVITEVDGENYTPNISAYINFYPFNGKVAKFGGTFGIGVPISSTARSFNFLFGGSAILGTESKVILHAGATLGQVKVLDNALLTGDVLPGAFEEVPTKDSYNWGAFIGIS
ncbi:MAG: hypothetical protein ACI8UQ_000957, partial [Bacteroidia bacterium]